MTSPYRKLQQGGQLRFEALKTSCTHTNRELIYSSIWGINQEIGANNAGRFNEAKPLNCLTLHCANSLELSNKTVSKSEIVGNPSTKLN